MIRLVRRSTLCAVGLMIVFASGCLKAKGHSDMHKASGASASVEDLNDARGKIFHVDKQRKCFELLKETVFDPRTNEGRSRHTVYWSDSTRFTKVQEQNSFDGIKKPAKAYFPDLDEANAAEAQEGREFVVMKALIMAGHDDAAALKRGGSNIVGTFTPDPDSEKMRGGTIEFDGRKVPVRLKGPRAQVQIRTDASEDDVCSGFWEVRLKGGRSGDRFVADSMEIFPLPDPRQTDDPNLPRVLVVGDSISMNYHESARAALNGIANYHRIDGNGGPSDRGVACMELWLGDYQQKGLHWDLIQFNHGLHDLKQVYDEATGSYGTHQVAIDDYRANLEKEIGIMKKTGAKLMWCTTTPVPNDSFGKWPEGTFGRRKDEDLVYNKAAMEVIAKHPEIMVNDINSFIHESSDFDQWRQQKDVHFWGKPEQDLVGRRVAEAIKKGLGGDGKTIDCRPQTAD